MLQLLLCLSLHQSTSLHIAAGEGHKLTVEFLFEKGAKIHLKDNAEVGV